MRQTACLVVNQIAIDSYAFLFNCMTAVWASDSMTATDRSKAVVTVLFTLRSVLVLILCGFVVLTTERFMSSIAWLFFSHLSIAIRELVYMLLVHLLVYFALVIFFSLPTGVRGWLRLVNVAHTGLFYERF